MCSININGDREHKRPILTPNEAIKLVERKYDLYVTKIEEMNGYDDRNYKLEIKSITGNCNIKTIWPHGYVLKIINSDDSKNVKVIEAQNSLMLYLNKHKFNVPTPVSNKEGHLHSLEELNTCPGVFYVVKLLTYQPGLLLNETIPSVQLYKNVGAYMAEVNIAMENFQHEGYKDYKCLWDLENVSAVRSYYHLLDNQQLAVIEQHIFFFENHVLPILPCLEKGIIHGDFNQHNLLIDGVEIRALLDFGDAHFAPYLFEVAICVCYMLVHGKDISCGRDIIRGYMKRRKLTDVEEKLIKACVCARLCQSIVFGLHSYQKYKNTYVLSSNQSGWNILKQLSTYDEAELCQLWNLKYSIA